MKENSLVWLRLNWELKSTVNIGLFNSQAKRMLKVHSGGGGEETVKSIELLSQTYSEI